MSKPTANTSRDWLGNKRSSVLARWFPFVAIIGGLFPLGELRPLDGSAIPETTRLCRAASLHDFGPPAAHYGAYVTDYLRGVAFALKGLAARLYWHWP
jgi:hypothetical protein